jgi:signal recognition particle receptor subunit beta
LYANKQDLPNALSPNELAEELRLTSQKKVNWYIQVNLKFNLKKALYSKRRKSKYKNNLGYN